jgi:hypothetical protein
MDKVAEAHWAGQKFILDRLEEDSDGRWVLPGDFEGSWPAAHEYAADAGVEYVRSPV